MEKNSHKEKGGNIFLWGVASACSSTHPPPAGVHKYVWGFFDVFYYIKLLGNRFVNLTNIT